MLYYNQRQGRGHGSCQQWTEDVSRNWIQFGGLCQGKEQNWWKRWGHYILRLELNWFARLADDQNEYHSNNIRTSNEGKHCSKKRPGKAYTTIQGGKIQAQNPSTTHNVFDPKDLSVVVSRFALEAPILKTMFSPGHFFQQHTSYLHNLNN